MLGQQREPLVLDEKTAITSDTGKHDFNIDNSEIASPKDDAPADSDSESNTHTMVKKLPTKKRPMAIESDEEDTPIADTLSPPALSTLLETDIEKDQFYGAPLDVAKELDTLADLDEDLMSTDDEASRENSTLHQSQALSQELFNEQPKEDQETKQVPSRKKMPTKKELFEIECETQRLLRQTKVGYTVKECSFTIDDFMAKMGLKREAPSSSYWGYNKDDDDDDENDGTYGEDNQDTNAESAAHLPSTTEPEKLESTSEAHVNDTSVSKDHNEVVTNSESTQSVPLSESIENSNDHLERMGVEDCEKNPSVDPSMDSKLESDSMENQQDPLLASATKNIKVDRIVTAEEARKMFQQSKILIQKKLAVESLMDDVIYDDDNDSDGLEIIEIQDHTIKPSRERARKEAVPGKQQIDFRKMQLQLAEKQLKEAKKKAEMLAEAKRKEKELIEETKRKLREALIAKRREERALAKALETSSQQTANSGEGGASAPLFDSTIESSQPEVKESSYESQDLDIDADYIDPTPWKEQKQAEKDRTSDDEMFTESQFAIPADPMMNDSLKTNADSDLSQNLLELPMPESQETQSSQLEDIVKSTAPSQIASSFNTPLPTLKKKSPKKGSLAYFFQKPKASDKTQSSDSSSTIVIRETQTEMMVESQNSQTVFLSQSLFLRRERDGDIEDELENLLSGRPLEKSSQEHTKINLDTHALPIAEENELSDKEPLAKIPKPTVRRGRIIVDDETDEESESEEESESVQDKDEMNAPSTRTASPVLAAFTRPPEQKKSEFIEEEAEEEDDEFKGLGGPDGEDLIGADLDKDDPNLVVKDDEADPLEGIEDVLALHMKQIHDQDKLDIDALLNDVTSGALRKKGFGVALRASRHEGTSGKGFELEDSDDDEAMIRRLKSRYAKYHKSTHGDDDSTALEKYANNPETAAFAKCMAVDSDTKGFLSSGSEDEENETPQTTEGGSKAGKKAFQRKMSISESVDDQRSQDDICLSGIKKTFDLVDGGMKRKRTILMADNTASRSKMTRPNQDEPGMKVLVATNMSSASMLVRSKSPKTIQRLKAAGLLGQQKEDNTKAKGRKGGFSFVSKSQTE